MVKKQLPQKRHNDASKQVMRRNAAKRRCAPRTHVKEVCRIHLKPAAFDQTYKEFADLKEFLTLHNANVKDHTVRTWLYCRDVDNNYAGLVQARLKKSGCSKTF